MDLTPENKQHIDELSYISLLEAWRFARCGDPWFQGETGIYWLERMKHLRNQPGGHAEHVHASKTIGWEK